MRLTDFAKATLKDRYMTGTDREPEDVFIRAIKAHSSGKHRERMLKYVDERLFIPSTPTLANAGTTRGSDIACFLNEVPDSREGITNHYTETSWLASDGGGVGGYWGHLRSTGMKTSHGSSSNGAIPFIGVVDRLVIAFAQGETRRASYAGFMPDTHPEIVEFVNMRRPTGGDINRKNLNLHHGICLSAEFYKAVDDDADWNLIDPHTKEVVEVLRARWLWELILDTRDKTGEPYLANTSVMADLRPDILKMLGVSSHTTNLCTEITTAVTLPDGERVNGVCCLGSVNVVELHKLTDGMFYQVIEDGLRYLDNVLDAFIDGPSRGADAAKKGAAYYRDVGLGTLGFHTLLQMQRIPVDSALAYSMNRVFYRRFGKAVREANEALGRELGACPAAQKVGLPYRFTHASAIAPNSTTGIFMDVSSGIEPLTANGFVRKTASGTEIYFNPVLRADLEELGLFSDELVTDIVVNNGSIQHLRGKLPDWMLDVYKTAFEVDQVHLVEQAYDRQPYIDQSQSLNLFFPPQTTREYFNKVHLRAQKCKTVYYRKSVASHKASTGVKVQKIVQDVSAMDSDCPACGN